MRILIAGAGIGGLTAALSLHAAGLSDILVFEAASDIREIGVGVNLPPHAVRELVELGLGEELAAIGWPTSELSYFSRAGQLIWAEPRGIKAGYRWPQYSVHRGRLQQMLLSAVHNRLGTGVVYPGKRVLSVDCASASNVGIDVVDSSTGITEHWDGDAFIAADGIRSVSRRSILGRETKLASNGWVMYRGATRHTSFLGGHTMVIVGDETLRIVVYALDAETLNWLLVKPMASEESMSELGNWNKLVDASSIAEHVADWQFSWLDIPRMVRGTSGVYEYPMADIDPLPFWSVNRATLLGDAAHAMYPFGSNGASQAILDARVLAYRVANSHSDVIKGLRLYESDRREQVAAVQLANRRQAGDVMAIVGSLVRSNAHGKAQEALKGVEQGYKKLAGFDVETLNQRASWSVLQK